MNSTATESFYRVSDYDAGVPAAFRRCAATLGGTAGIRFDLRKHDSVLCGLDTTVLVAVVASSVQPSAQ